MKSKCMDIVNSLAQEDQDNLLDKLDHYIKMGVPPEKAQRMAASDVMEEIKQEHKDFIKLVEEQHPDAEKEDDGHGNSGSGLADQAGRGVAGKSGASGQGGEGVAAELGSGPRKPAGADAVDSKRHPESDEDLAVGRLEAALRDAGKNIGDGIKADASLPETKELNALLNAFAGLTGKRGIAIDWADGSYGVQHGKDFFVNISDPDFHVAQVIGHEFAHLGERFPGVGNLYKDIWSMIDGKGKRDYFQYLKRTEQVKSATFEKATAEELKKLKSEMIADFFGQRFNDKDWLEQLATDRPHVFGQFVRDWIKALGAVITRLKGKVSSLGSVKNVDRYIEQLEEAKAIAKEVAAIWADQNKAKKKGIDATKDIEAKLSWETRPGKSTGLLHKMGSEFDSREQSDYLIAIRNALSRNAPDAQTLLGWGKDRYSEKRDGSASNGLTGWSMQSTLRLPNGIVDARTKAEIEFFLSLNGLLTGQEGMAWHAPRFGKDGLGVEFDLGGTKLRDTQFEEVYAAIQQEFKRNDIPPIPSKDGLRFLNYTDIPQEEFAGKLKRAIAHTSVHDIWESTYDKNHSGRIGEAHSEDGRGNSPLRAGTSDLQGGRDHDVNAFQEGIRTFDFDGDRITNDWSEGDGQYRQKLIEAWQQLKDLPGHNLPRTLDALNEYLKVQQDSVDQANRYFAENYKLGKAELSPQERESGVASRSEFPSFTKAQTARAQGAYFRHPDGTLMTLYHGSGKEIGKIEARDGISFFATTLPHYANEAARISSEFLDDADAQNVAPIHVLANNPFDWRIAGNRDKVEAFMEKYPKGFSEKAFPAALKAGKFDLLESREFADAAKKAGFDSVLVRDDKNFTGFVNVGVFDPKDVVSAINPDVQFSARVPQVKKRDFVGRTNRAYTEEQLKAFANVGFEVEQPTLIDRAKAIWKDAGKKLAQGLVDQFAPIKELSQDAYGLLRLAKGAAGSFETLLRGGKLKLTDGVYDFDETQKGGVVDKLLIPMQGEHHDFLRWVAANRAERLLGDGRENLFTQDDIDAIKTLADGDLGFDYTLQNGPRAGQKTRIRAEMYADSLITFNGFHDNVMDMAEQSGLIDKEERATWTSEFYVPFYRVSDDDGAGVRMGGGSVRMKAFKALKGGMDMLNADLLDNTLMNWAHLLDASAKNRAAKASLEAAERAGVAVSSTEEAARQMGKATANRNGVVWFMDEGQPHYYLVDDPFVLRAITSLEYAGMKNPMMNALSAAKNFMTIGVTSSPFFKIRNLIRDSVQVIGTSGISLNPVKNLKDGWAMTNPENDIYFRLLAGGGTIHFGTMLEGSEAKRVQALVESGVDAAAILGDEHKLKTFFRKYIEPGVTAYNELGNRGEAINRAALYDQLVKQGVSHADASLQARDLMDFSMQGSFASVRFLTQVVPFLNARIQGLYKLGRAAKEDPQRMAYVTGAVALASLALLAAYGDDDDWKKREDWDRNNFWWFKFGGTAFRIPKPFELGAIGTLAERSAELLFSDEMTGTRFRGQVLTLLGDNLSMNPVPQLVKPMLDVYANKDSFTGRPIETMGMERLQADHRFTNGTTMAARAISTSMNSVSGLVGSESLSPVQVDSLIRGYFGWLGTFMAAVPDMAARYATGQPTQPSSDLWKVASGGIAAQLDDAPSRYVTHVYDQAKALEQAYGTWRSLQKDGLAEDARDFRAANEDKIRGYHNVESIKGAIAKINQQIRAVEHSNMDGDAMRAEIQRLNARKEQFARRLAA